MSKKLPFPCKRCDRSFDSKIGFGMHKKWHKNADRILRETGKRIASARRTREQRRNPDGTLTSKRALAKRIPGHRNANFSGRTQALMLLDSMLSEVRSQEKLKNSLRERMRENPIEFFKTIIMPLLPKESLLRFGGEDLPSKLPILITMSDKATVDKGSR